MSVSRRIARPLLSTAFVVGGVAALRDPSSRTKVAEPLLPVADKLGLPSDAATLVKVTSGVQLGAGVLLAIGRLPRLAATALLVTTVPVIYGEVLETPFWQIDDPTLRGREQARFLKNLGLAGGLLLAAFDTDGKPSVGWRTSRKAKRASQLVSAGTALAGTKAAKGKKKTKASRSGAASAVKAASVQKAASAAKAATANTAITKKMAKSALKANSEASKRAAKQARKQAGMQAAKAGFAISAGSNRAGGLISSGSGSAANALASGGRRAGELISSGSANLAAGSGRAGDALATGTGKMANLVADRSKRLNQAG